MFRPNDRLFVQNMGMIGRKNLLNEKKIGDLRMGEGRYMWSNVSRGADDDCSI